MDKYEYNLKLDQIKQLYVEEKYEEAANLADEINWNRVRNVNTLVKIGEIYEQAERYEDARDILLLAYERSPLGRMIVYHLAEIALKMDELDEAEEYSNEFARIAPHDNLKYVLSYDIEKAKGAPYDKLIAILEEYKEQDFQEKEAYELAELYSLNGQEDKCAAVCDELILWFGEGQYVEKALELKKKYQPLTKAQEEKYRQIIAKKNGVTEIAPEMMVRAGEYGHDAVSIPEVNVTDGDKFSTVNLQAEIAKGIQKIMEAKKQGEDTPLTVEQVKEQFPNLQIDRDQQMPLPAEEPKQENLFSMDSDGQISLMTEPDHVVEKQITGQMTIQDVLQEIDQNQQDAAEPVSEAEEPAVRKPVVEQPIVREPIVEEPIVEEENSVETAEPETGMPEEGDTMEYDTMKNTDDVLPVIADPEDILAEEDNADMAASASEKITEDIAQAASDIERYMNDEDDEDEPEDITDDDDEDDDEADDDEVEDDEVEEEDDDDDIDSEIDDDDIIDDDEEEEVPTRRAFRRSRRDAAEAIAMVEEDTDVEEEIISEPTIPMPDLKEALSAAAAQRAIEDQIEKIPLTRKGNLEKLTEDMRYAFAYFVPIRGMEDQILDAINDISMRLTSENAANYGNLIITGEPGCGKTVLATTMIRILQQYCGRPVGKVGKISAKALNNKDIQTLMQKVGGGCLIIENAGELSHRSIATMSYLMDTDKTGLLIVLEDSAKAMRKLLALDELFARKFTSRISIPIFTPDELVAFARSYSKEQGYKIDDLAILALYQRISNIQKLDKATTLGEVKEIVDNAIKKEAKWSMHKYISILTAKRYTKDDRILLSERDFK